MDAPLLGPVTAKCTDHSTTKIFAFSFYCDRCGKEWRSTPQAFAPGELGSPLDIRVFRMLWAGQHKAAYEKANLEALCAFYYCQACSMRVCMDCFCRAETDMAELCTACLPGGASNKQSVNQK